MKSLINVMLLGAMTALLLAAATPNFLDAQVRQRLARAYANMPVMSAAVEAYKVDHGKYPFDGAGSTGVPRIGYSYWYLPFHVTTPVAYMTTILGDPFREDRTSLPSSLKGYRYTNIRSSWGTDYLETSNSSVLAAVLQYWGEYHFVCVGPDGLYGPYSNNWYNPPINYQHFNIPYDPTNGLVSEGDIDRGQKRPPYLN